MNSTPPPDATIRERFIGGMSRAASTVNIVTTDGVAGRMGVTVSAMSSVSADAPRPTLLVCVHHQSPVADAIIANGVFCVNILKDDQSYISDAFAGRFRDQLADKFDCTNWETMPSGAPRVVDPLVAFDCKVLSADRIGTHHVFFGEVDDVFIADRGSPLIYARRAYGAATRIEAAASVKSGMAAVDSKLTVACFHTIGPIMLPDIIRRMVGSDPGLHIGLVEGDQRRVQESLLSGECDVALLYDIGLSDGLETRLLVELPPYVLLAHDHVLADKPALTPADLADHPMVMLNVSPSQDYFTTVLQAAGVTPRVAYRSGNFEMVRGLVGQGLGYTLLTTRPAASVSYDGRLLVTRPLQADTAPSRVMLATRKGETPSVAVDKFIWFCRDFFDPDE